MIVSLKDISRQTGSERKSSLNGIRVLVTRPADQSETMIRKLKDEGAIPVLFPTIEISPVRDSQVVEGFLKRISDYDWIVFASANALKYFLGWAVRRNSKHVWSQTVSVCTVGEKTRQLAESAGLNVDLVPDVHTKTGILEALGARGVRGQRILIPCGNLSKADLAFGLMQMGARVDSVVVYETRSPNRRRFSRIAGLLFRGKIQVLTFTSPSTFQNFMDIFHHQDFFSQSGPAIIAAIGETTASCIRSNGYPVHVIPDRPDVTRMIDAIRSYLEEKPVYARV